MKPTSTIPISVLEAGLPVRFRYWSGRSGARYLFTRTDLATIDQFDAAVAIVVRFGRIIWAGPIPAEPPVAADLVNLAQRDGAEVFVHLLARSAESRSGIIDDLRAVIHVGQIDTDGRAQILEFPAAA